MNFELGKSYIVDVTEKGIIPLMEFDRNLWVNKDYDDLDFLTDEEKEVIVNGVLNKIRAEIHKVLWKEYGDTEWIEEKIEDVEKVISKVIDKYKNDVK